MRQTAFKNQYHSCVRLSTLWRPFPPPKPLPPAKAISQVIILYPGHNPYPGHYPPPAPAGYPPTLPPYQHQAHPCTRTPRSQQTKNGYHIVKSKVDGQWVVVFTLTVPHVTVLANGFQYILTWNVIKAVRRALAHAVWIGGQPLRHPRSIPPSPNTHTHTHTHKLYIKTQKRPCQNNVSSFLSRALTWSSSLGKNCSFRKNVLQIARSHFPPPGDNQVYGSRWGWGYFCALRHLLRHHICSFHLNAEILHFSATQKCTAVIHSAVCCEFYSFSSTAERCRETQHSVLQGKRPRDF